MLILNLFAAHPLYAVLWVVAVVLSLTIHEFSHGLAARLQGDPTAEEEGRLTFNPLAHIDWLGFALLLIAGFGWAKPTPFNPYNLKYKRFGPALVALAGPFSNIVFTVFVGIAFMVAHQTAGLGADNFMMVFFVLIMYINLLLAVFNIIPIPPLDGSKVLATLIGHRRPDLVMLLERYGTWLLLLLIIFGGGVLGRIFFFFFTLLHAFIAQVSPSAAQTMVEVLVRIGFLG